jgi:hypothetical protein
MGAVCLFMRTLLPQTVTTKITSTYMYSFKIMQDQTSKKMPSPHTLSIVYRKYNTRLFISTIKRAMVVYENQYSPLYAVQHQIIKHC